MPLKHKSCQGLLKLWVQKCVNVNVYPNIHELWTAYKNKAFLSQDICKHGHWVINSWAPHCPCWAHLELHSCSIHTWMFCLADSGKHWKNNTTLMRLIHPQFLNVGSYFLSHSLFSYSQSLCCSYPAVCDFLQNNNLLSIIRAHEAQDAGYVFPCL